MEPTDENSRTGMTIEKQRHIIYGTFLCNASAPKTLHLTLQLGQLAKILGLQQIWQIMVT